MGTKIHCESYLPGYHSMRDLNEDSSSSSWPVCYGDKPVTNGQCYNGYGLPRTTIDLCPVNNKDALKQKMLEHEAVFKDQVYELHRLYQRQRDMMEEVRRSDLHRLRESMEPSSSSSLRGPQLPSNDTRKWHMAGFPLSNSPMSCTKGNGHSPYQNGSVSKETEALSMRPVKVRKKLFDLQLPADECIEVEEGEKLPQVKVSDVSSYSSTANLRIDLESRRKLPLSSDCTGFEPDCRIVASTSASRLRKSTGLADLNEPIVVDEPSVAPSPPVFHGSINRLSTHVNGFLVDSVESKANESRRCLPGIHETGKFIPMNYSPGNYPTSRCREDPWKSRDCVTNSHLEPIGSSSRANGSLPFFGSCVVGSWPQSASSWSKQAQKLTSLEPSSSPSCQVAPFGGNWRAGASTMPYQHLGGEPMTGTAANGFYQGSTSGLKDLKAHFSSGFDYPSMKSTNASDRTVNNGFGNFPNGSCRVDLKPVLNINLNEAISKESIDEEVVVLHDHPGSRKGKGKPEDCPTMTLPWLKRKATDELEASSKHLRNKTEMIGDLNEPFIGPSDGDVTAVKVEIVEAQSGTKILGVPVGVENKPSLNVKETNNVNSLRKRRVIDINLECMPDEQIAEEELIKEKEKPLKASAFIDLNSCASDCEEPSVPPSYRTKLEIDLEAPAVADEDESLSACEQVSLTVEVTNEVVRNAAETVLAISSFSPRIQTDPEATLDESLLRFINALSNKLETAPNKIDEFESMALQLQETKEVDYMPDPFVPDYHKIEELGSNAALSRPRRGQSRRGRPRRDFQRDILPGLATMSRHEVTEDIQIFTGLMRATGHQWTSGLARRNGGKTRGARGRRRAGSVAVSETVIPGTVCTSLVNNIEGGLEDRSLAGWGKTTRRPRRQRCPAGNPPAIVLT